MRKKRKEILLFKWITSFYFFMGILSVPTLGKSRPAMEKEHFYEWDDKQEVENKTQKPKLKWHFTTKLFILKLVINEGIEILEFISTLMFRMGVVSFGKNYFSRDIMVWHSSISR